MSEMQQANGGGVVLSTQRMVPRVQQIGSREIEITFLGNNSKGQPTWILWNPDEPFLIGVLSQGKIGFTFEQSTDHGVMLHKDISLRRLQRAIEG